MLVSPPEYDPGVAEYCHHQDNSHNLCRACPQSDLSDCMFYSARGVGIRELSVCVCSDYRMHERIEDSALSQRAGKLNLLLRDAQQLNSNIASDALR